MILCNHLVQVTEDKHIPGKSVVEVELSDDNVVKVNCYVGHI